MNRYMCAQTIHKIKYIVYLHKHTQKAKFLDLADADFNAYGFRFAY